MVKPTVLRGQPRHCTVVISLWGLQLKYPEDILAKDVIKALSLNRSAEKALNKYQNQPQKSIEAARDEVSSAISQSLFGARMCILSCFNLVEAFVNGLAWDFSKNAENMDALSNKKRKLIQDGSIRDKLLKYPEIITGKALWGENDEALKSFLEQVKPFRDSLVHPSPFSTPGRYGGHDKLEHLYRIDSKKAEQAAKASVDLIAKLLEHVSEIGEIQPMWFKELFDGVQVGNRVQRPD